MVVSVAIGVVNAPPVVPEVVSVADGEAIISEAEGEAMTVSEAIADGETVACKALNKAAGEALALGEAVAPPETAGVLLVPVPAPEDEEEVPAFWVLLQSRAVHGTGTKEPLLV